jgi:hypothetical protein
MIEYQLKDADGNTFSLNGDTVVEEFTKTWKQGSDDYAFESKIIERSFLPGASLVGEPRVAARTIVLTSEYSNDDSATYRAYLNGLLQAVFNARWLVDVTNSMEIEIVAQGSVVEYMTGSLKLSSDNSFEFLTLTPYWRATTESSVNGTVLADTLTAIPITISGFAPVSPIITLVTTAAVNSLQLTVDSTLHSLQIDDALFGTAGNLTMVIDCSEGTVTIGALNRNTSIVDGTGFFQIPTGSQEINALFADEDVDYTIKYRSLSWL